MTHVFTAEEFGGFHVGDTTLRGALDRAVRALGKHVTALYNLKEKAHYDLLGTPEDFEYSLHDADNPAGGSVVVKMAENTVGAHVN